MRRTVFSSRSELSCPGRGAARSDAPQSRDPCLSKFLSQRTGPRLSSAAPKRVEDARERALGASPRPGAPVARPLADMANEPSKNSFVYAPLSFSLYDLEL